MLNWIAEQRIQNAIRAGEFDDLPGANKPLPPDTLDPLIPAHLRVAMRVIGNAGGLPAELLMRRELAQVDKEIARCQSSRHACNTECGTEVDRDLPDSLEQNDLKKLLERRLELLIGLRSSR